jgi:hypothetical protein
VTGVAGCRPRFTEEFVCGIHITGEGLFVDSSSRQNAAGERVFIKESNLEVHLRIHINVPDIGAIASVTYCNYSHPAQENLKQPCPAARPHYLCKQYLLQLPSSGGTTTALQRLKKGFQTAKVFVYRYVTLVQTLYSTYTLLPRAVVVMQSRSSNLPDLLVPPSE